MTGPGRPPRLYRLMLRSFPHAFREEFGDEMARLFLDRRREAGGSWRARGGVWARGVGDVATHAIAERWQRPRPQPGSARKGASPLERWLADVRYALRGIRRSPGFAAAAVVTLALGIGANVAIFTAVNAVLLRPLPFPESDRLVRVWPQYNFNKFMIDRVNDASPALENVSGMSGWLFTLTGEGDPQQISGALVSWDHFELLGVLPALGRTFAPEEGLVGQADVVILSHGLWANVFGADPDIIGRRIRLAAGEYQTRRVVGVMATDFRPLEPSYRLWSPLDVDPSLVVREDSSWYVNSLIGRLADGATADQATSQVRSVAQAMHEEWPERFEEDEGRTASVVPLQAHMVRNLSSTLWTLLAAVGVVLLIACVNVANLLLARGNARRRELAMRAALGATRGRLLSQLLTESTLLGFGGCFAGMGVAWGCLGVLGAVAPEDFYQVAEAGIDPLVMAFALGISIVSVSLFGLVPACRASSAAPGGLAGRARGVAGGRTAHRLTRTLVAAEVALSVVLVVGAGLMLRSLWQLYTDDLGFNPAGVLTFRISIPEGRFEQEALAPHYRQIWEAVNAVPGVEQSGGIHLLPLTGSNWNFPYLADDHPVPEGTPRPNANHRVVTPSYFGTLGIPVLRGRGFTDRDTHDAEQVGLINDRMARDLWPGEDPVGKKIEVFGSTFTVVGVVGDIHQHGIRRETEAEMYRPFDQWSTGGMFAVIRTSGDPDALAPSVQRAIWQVDPNAPIAQVRSMERVFGESVAGSPNTLSMERTWAIWQVDPNAPIAQVRSMERVFGESVAGDRFVSLLITAFGVLALALGAIGVYGVTAYAIGQRLREFGVRMALGANRSVVLRQAIGNGVRPALVGVALGVGAALWAARLLASLLHNVSPYDAVTFFGVPAVLIAVATLACALPAWRASRLDPVSVLRNE